jgi:hypothetical protein
MGECTSINMVQILFNFGRSTLILHCRWLYALFIAIDANFRLKRKAVSSDEVDPGLNTGWAYFVEETKYKKYLSARAGEKQEVCVLLYLLVMSDNV